jgi:hypothetical protein
VLHWIESDLQLRKQAHRYENSWQLKQRGYLSLFEFGLFHSLHALFHSNFPMCIDRSLVCSIHFISFGGPTRTWKAMTGMWWRGSPRKIMLSVRKVRPESWSALYYDCHRTPEPTGWTSGRSGGIGVRFGVYRSLRGHNLPVKRSMQRKCGSVPGHYPYDSSRPTRAKSDDPQVVLWREVCHRCDKVI